MRVLLLRHLLDFIPSFRFFYIYFSFFLLPRGV
jgi:hypothetical protein